MASCLFCDVAEGKLPANVVYEDADIIAFNDITPRAPIHLLIIPKRHLATLNAIEIEHVPLLGHMIYTAKQLAADFGLSEAGYRLVFNVNPDGGQTVYHIHLHLLGGRALTWPPG